ncbi:aminotransferase class III-fold pyridoxal phosphate-dependent enzyme [Christiangramia sp.]|uniref:aminotransferase class III-fold pyridoxal phosphate-dependent enzyme n=1 Tax=Christiangramia sp. TaxID=1931228 RepID=UPI002621CB07|nr:aminotransferase class III-fold pyridoxal phosphate-dependent enzyme [Christiangramia sp.]
MSLLQADQQTILDNNLNHTLFSWSKQKGISPLLIEKAKGVYLHTYDGKKIIDFSSGLMNVNIGHGHQRVTRAVVDQMEKVSYVTPACATEVRGELGKKLAEICPGDLNKAFFTVCGATAIENAIKLARLYTGRHKILTRYRSYHGSTMGAMSAGGDPRKHKVDVHQGTNFVHFEIPYEYRSSGKNWEKECEEQLERIIAYEGHDNIAAIMMEGESGSSGCLKLPPGYWKKLREICDKYGILLIADEVMSGFGRTGKWFGVDNYEVVPDLMAMAKGLTSGYLPLGCLMVSDKIAAKFDEETLALGLTYSAHATACAAALEVIKIYEDENLLENARDMGRYIESEIKKLKEKHPSIGDFRNTGLLGCLELVKNRNTREPMAPFNAKPEEMEVINKVAAKIKELGMYTFVRWGYIFVAPPLCINKEEIDEGLAIISEALKIADASTV